MSTGYSTYSLYSHLSGASGLSPFRCLTAVPVAITTARLEAHLSELLSSGCLGITRDRGPGVHLDGVARSRFFRVQNLHRLFLQQPLPLTDSNQSQPGTWDCGKLSVGSLVG